MSKKNKKDKKDKSGTVKVTLTFQVTNQGAYTAGRVAALSALGNLLDPADLAIVGLALADQQVTER